MLEVKNLSLTKGKTVILSDLSLSFQKKSITLLLGESGSGKSSLLRCLAGLETEYRGEITFDGNFLRGMSSFARVKIMSFISQSYALFPHMTVLENCQGALKIVFKDDADVAKRKSMEALDRLGMSAYANAYPHQLSGGQKQRVAIARALVLNPEMLLFDEPTSALDPTNAKMLSQILQELSRQSTGIIIATHDLLFAKELENDLGSSYRKEIISKA